MTFNKPEVTQQQNHLFSYEILRSKAVGSFALSAKNPTVGTSAGEPSRFAGEFTARVPPVPIPNTEVKPRWADGTARESVWEIR